MLRTFTPQWECCGINEMFNGVDSDDIIRIVRGHYKACGARTRGPGQWNLHDPKHWNEWVAQVHKGD